MVQYDRVNLLPLVLSVLRLRREDHLIPDWLRKNRGQCLHHWCRGSDISSRDIPSPCVSGRSLKAKLHCLEAKYTTQPSQPAKKLSESELIAKEAEQALDRLEMLRLMQSAKDIVHKLDQATIPEQSAVQREEAFVPRLSEAHRVDEFVPSAIMSDLESRDAKNTGPLYDVFVSANLGGLKNVSHLLPDVSVLEAPRPTTELNRLPPDTVQPFRQPELTVKLPGQLMPVKPSETDQVLHAGTAPSGKSNSLTIVGKTDPPVLRSMSNSSASNTVEKKLAKISPKQLAPSSKSPLGPSSPIIMAKTTNHIEPERRSLSSVDSKGPPKLPGVPVLPKKNPSAPLEVKKGSELPVAERTAPLRDLSDTLGSTPQGARPVDLSASLTTKTNDGSNDHVAYPETASKKVSEAGKSSSLISSVKNNPMQKSDKEETAINAAPAASIDKTLSRMKSVDQEITPVEVTKAPMEKQDAPASESARPGEDSKKPKIPMPPPKKPPPTLKESGLLKPAHSEDITLKAKENESARLALKTELPNLARGKSSGLEQLVVQKTEAEVMPKLKSVSSVPIPAQQSLGIDAEPPEANVSEQPESAPAIPMSKWVGVGPAQSRPSPDSLSEKLITSPHTSQKSFFLNSSVSASKSQISLDGSSSSQKGIGLRRKSLVLSSRSGSLLDKSESPPTSLEDLNKAANSELPLKVDTLLAGGSGDAKHPPVAKVVPKMPPPPTLPKMPLLKPSSKALNTNKEAPQSKEQVPTVSITKASSSSSETSQSQPAMAQATSLSKNPSEISRSGVASPDHDSEMDKTNSSGPGKQPPIKQVIPSPLNVDRTKSTEQQPLNVERTKSIEQQNEMANSNNDSMVKETLNQANSNSAVPNDDKTPSDRVMKAKAPPAPILKKPVPSIPSLKPKAFDPSLKSKAFDPSLKPKAFDLLTKAESKEQKREQPVFKALLERSRQDLTENILRSSSFPDKVAMPEKSIPRIDNLSSFPMPEDASRSPLFSASVEVNAQRSRGSLSKTGSDLLASLANPKKPSVISVTPKSDSRYVVADSAMSMDRSIVKDVEVPSRNEVVFKQGSFADLVQRKNQPMKAPTEAVEENGSAVKDSIMTSSKSSLIAGGDMSDGDGWQSVNRVRRKGGGMSPFVLQAALLKRMMEGEIEKAKSVGSSISR